MRLAYTQQDNRYIHLIKSDFLKTRITESLTAELCWITGCTNDTTDKNQCIKIYLLPKQSGAVQQQKKEIKG